MKTRTQTSRIAEVGKIATAQQGNTRIVGARAHRTLGLTLKFITFLGATRARIHDLCKLQRFCFWRHAPRARQSGVLAAYAVCAPDAPEAVANTGHPNS